MCAAKHWCVKIKVYTTRIRHSRENQNYSFDYLLENNKIKSLNRWVTRVRFTGTQTNIGKQFIRWHFVVWNATSSFTLRLLFLRRTFCISHIILHTHRGFSWKSSDPQAVWKKNNNKFSKIYFMKLIYAYTYVNMYTRWFFKRAQPIFNLVQRINLNFFPVQFLKFM